MKAALSERDYQPIKVDLVPLGSGVWCEGTPAAGELSTQGVVEVDGKRDRFDQAIGQGWMVIGYNANPADALNAQQRDALQRLDGRMIKIGAAGTDCDAIDCEGTYAKWLASIDANYFILRPDFYVAATAKSAESLRSHFDEVLSKLYLKQ
jgi:3-(3-hydroxy-phenyl)propionate hydroxylase